MIHLKTQGNENFTLPLAIFLLALSLRLWSISFGLPHLYHADEPIVVNHALAYGTGDLNPHFFKIPPLISYLLFFLFGSWFFLGKAIGLFHSTQDFQNLFFSNPTNFYLIGRIVFGAFAGASTVYLLYKLVRKHFDLWRALTASLLLAVGFLHVSDSHYLYADIPLTLSLVYGFYAIFNLFEHPPTYKFKLHALCGFLIGAAAAVKYNGIFLAIPYVIAVTLLSIPLTSKIEALLKSGFISLLTFLAFNPWVFLDSQTFFRELQVQSASQNGSDYFFHHLTYSLSGSVGWPILFLALSGIFTALFPKSQSTESRKRFIAAIFCLAYYGVLVKWGQPYSRYVLPLLPLVCFFAADFTAFLYRRNPKSFLSIIMLGVLIFGIGQNLWNSIRFNQIMGESDTRTVSREWILANVRANSKIALDLDFAMPRLPWSQRELIQKLNHIKGQAKSAQIKRLEFLIANSSQAGYRLYSLSDSLQPQSSEFLMDKQQIPYNFQALRKEGIQYILITRLWEKDAHQNFYDQLLQEKEGRLIASFNPYKNEQPAWSLEHPLTGGAFKSNDLARRARNGQPLYLYQLNP